MGETTTDFLRAMARGKHRKGSGNRLRRLIAEQEKATFGALACYCCGYPLALRSSTVEHVTPRSLGGRTVLPNLALSHAACNEARGNAPTPRAPMRAEVRS